MLIITDIMKYRGYSKNKLRRILADTCVIDHNTGKRCYYEEVAAAITSKTSKDYRFWLQSICFMREQIKPCVCRLF